MIKSACAILLFAAAAAAASCEVDKRSILAPQGTQLQVAATVYLPVRQATTVTISAQENDGTPVADGTEILVASKLGSVDQKKVRTKNGSATVLYTAGDVIGVEQVTAWSGPTQAMVSFPIGSAAVSTIDITPELEFLPPGGGSVNVVALARSAEGEPVAGLPIRFTTTAGTLNVTEPVMTGADGKATARLTTPVTATVRANALNLTTDETVVAVRPPVTVFLTPAPLTPVAGQAVTFALTASADGEPATGVAGLSFGDGKSVVIGTITGTASVQHTYEAAGGYNATAVFLDTYAIETRVTVRVEVSAKPVVPNPPTPPPPGNPPPGAGQDQIDPREITWLSNSADVSGWAITSQLLSVDVNGSTICLPHTKAGQWPTVRWGNTPDTQVDFEATPFIVARVNGRWYAGAFDWFRVGATCKHMPIDEYGRDQIRVSPLDASWPGPQPGDLVGYLVTTPASNRILLRSSFERTNIVMIRWPGGDE